jgi:hypothetical protein
MVCKRWPREFFRKTENKERYPRREFLSGVLSKCQLISDDVAANDWAGHEVRKKTGET